MILYHKPRGMPIPEVLVYIVQEQDVPVIYQYPGRTGGYVTVDVRTRVRGIIKKTVYTEGQLVKEGDILFELDKEPFNYEYAQALANFEFAEQDWNRAKSLKPDNAISIKEYEQSWTAYQDTLAALNIAKTNLGYTTITAPVTGMTGLATHSDGNLVTPDTQISSLVTTITQVDPLYVFFSCSEAEVPIFYKKHQITPDLKVDLQLSDGSIYEQSGYIDFVESSIDAETAVVHIRATISNADITLLPNQFVKVLVSGITKKNAILIPEKALVQTATGSKVYVVNAEDKVEVLPVELGLSTEHGYIVEKGLKTGDKVIIEGQVRARPGTKVASITSEKS